MIALLRLKSSAPKFLVNQANTDLINITTDVQCLADVVTMSKQNLIQVKFDVLEEQVRKFHRKCLLQIVVFHHAIMHGRPIDSARHYKDLRAKLFVSRIFKPISEGRGRFRHRYSSKFVRSIQSELHVCYDI